MSTESTTARLHHPLQQQVGLTHLLLTITTALLPLLLSHATTTQTTSPTSTTAHTATPTTTQATVRTITHHTTQSPQPNSCSPVERQVHLLRGPHHRHGELPSPWYGNTASAQAAAAVAANAALAQAPSAPYYFVGSSAAEMQAQNAIIAATFGQQSSFPNQLVPYKPGSTPQFWCKELDGSWTLRELSDFTAGDLSAGRWEVHPTSGYRYFVKQPM